MPYGFIFSQKYEWIWDLEKIARLSTSGLGSILISTLISDSQINFTRAPPSSPFTFVRGKYKV